LASRDLGLPVPDEDAARHVIGLGLKDALEYAIPTLDPVDYPRLAERYRYHFLTRDAELVLFEGVREMLEALREQHYFLGVAT
ncbi:HAD hydrolase-like protein, partial [Acinetobacter baumannii]